MEIKTKLKPNQEFYAMWDNCIYRYKVKRIFVEVEGGLLTSITYEVFADSDSFTDDEVFATKDELIQHLIDNIK